MTCLNIDWLHNQRTSDSTRPRRRLGLGIRTSRCCNETSRGLRKIMDIEKVTKRIANLLRRQSDAKEEFDAFFLEWIAKYKLPKEAYRGVSYLMSSYVMNYIKD